MGGCNTSASRPNCEEDPNIHERAVNNVSFQFNDYLTLFAESDSAPLTFAHDDQTHIQNFIVPTLYTKRELYQYDRISKELDKVFIDPQFKPVTSSITTDTDLIKVAKDCVWKRPKEFLQGDIQVFVEDVSPNDIKQGSLGDCYFLGSLSSLAENSNMIQRLFVTDKYQENGLYCVWLCHNAEWVQVVLDDLIPVVKSTNKPAFSDTHGPEIWALFLDSLTLSFSNPFWHLEMPYYVSSLEAMLHFF